MSKKQFFLSMSKKQLISSLAVTGMMMGQIGGNVFANGNVNTSNTISSISNRAVSNGNIVVGNEIGNYVAGDESLSLPHTPYTMIQNPDKQPITEENYGNKHNIMEISAPNNKTKDTFTVIENRVNENQKSASEPYKVEAKVSDSRIDFIVTTIKGVTLGSLTNNATMDKKIEYKDMNNTVVYKFHYEFNNSGDHKIYINIGNVSSGNSGAVPGTGSTGQAENNVNSGSGNSGTVSGNGSIGSQNGSAGSQTGSSESKPNVSEKEKIDSEDKLINALNNVKNKEKVTIELKDDSIITLNKDLTVPNNVTIEGNGATINLNNSHSITLKGKDITLSNITITKAKNIGIQIYNSRNAMLKNVTVENTKAVTNGATSGFGIFVNGSEVTLQNCTTQHNEKGGIYVSRSALLNTKGCIDSAVSVVGSLTQNEEKGKSDVVVKNLEMVNYDKTKIKQNNTFGPLIGSYKEEKREVEEALSKSYIEKLNKQGLGIKESDKFKNEIITYQQNK